MAGWLTAAKKAFRKSDDEPPQAFTLRCDCGAAVSGVRARHAQSPLCPECRTPLFALPASVYPAPRAPAVTTPARLAAPPPTADLEPTTEIMTPPPVEAAPATARRARQEAATRRGERPLAGSAFEPLQERLARWRRKLLTPVRLVLLGVAGVVVLTAWWISHMRGLERARETLATLPRQAQEALDDSDLSEAARLYREINSALKQLGRRDRQALAWRQSALETTAVADLAPASLHELLDEAQQAASGAASDAWPELFRVHHRDGWVVIDAPVSQLEPDDPSGNKYRVHAPLAARDQQAVLVADVPSFARRVAPGGLPQRVVFAAQIIDCRRDAGQDGLWRIVLNPTTAFLWAQRETYEFLGMVADEATVKLLEEQAQTIGLER